MNILKRGFSLVEILVVVVILAVLVSLALPRYAGQTENANIAEAEQMLGALRRAQQRHMDISGNATFGTLDWRQLGLQQPTSGKFFYLCYPHSGPGPHVGPPFNLDDPSGHPVGEGWCFAQRGAFSGIYLYSDGFFSCVGNYTLLNDSDPSKGCKSKF